MYVTPASYWHEQECQADWTEPEPVAEINQAGFYACELMEGTLEIRSAELTELQAFLRQHPDFEENTDFINFMLDPRGRE